MAVCACVAVIATMAVQPARSIADGTSAGSDVSHQSAVGDIYQLQAAFHRAKTLQDIGLMMSLWAPDGVLHVIGASTTTYIGSDQLRTFWLHSGSFTHHRFSLVPSAKLQIVVQGTQAYLYFECHDVDNNPADASYGAIVADTFLAGTLRDDNGTWLFSDMTAGSSKPLTLTSYYNPFTGADLSGANWQGAVFPGGDLSNTDLQGANLQAVALPETDLAGANLQQANLKDADLSHANLNHADLTGANLTGVTWSNTTCPDGTNSDSDGGTCQNNL
jgi:hypothetical protein